jgi:cytoskeletal protein CcmA (bactofilin family)
MLRKRKDSEWPVFSSSQEAQAKPVEEPVVKDRVAEDLDGQTKRLLNELTAKRQPVAEPTTQTTTQKSVSSSYSSRMMSSESSSDDVESVIGRHSTFDGTYRSDQTIRIQGAVQGEIESKRSVFIEEQAKVNAKITAENITVSGHVEGDLSATGRLEITPSGRVSGEITAGVLIIQEGAFFEGHLKMKDKEAHGRPLK